MDPNMNEDCDLDDVFFTADEDDDGYLNVDELRNALASIGQVHTDAELEDVLSDFNETRDGHINRRQFRALVSYNVVRRSSLQKDIAKIKSKVDAKKTKKKRIIETNGDIFTLFKMFDYDRKGFLNKEKIQRGFRKLTGDDIPDDDVDVMMEQADENGDGKIDIYDFERCLKTNFFQEDD